METSNEWTIRILEPSDLFEVRGWYDQINEDAPSIELLPEKTSFIILKEDDPIAAISLYVTNGKLAWLDHLISNPKASKEVRRESLRLLDEMIRKFCKRLKIKRLVFTTRHQKLVERYKELGFEECEQSVSMMIREI